MHSRKKSNPPKDFEIIIEEKDFGRAEPMEGILSRVVDGKIYNVTFSLTTNEKQLIYNKILSNNLMELPVNYNPKATCNVLHLASYEVKILHNGVTHVIQVSDCSYDFFESFKTEKCLSVLKEIMDIIDGKKEVKKIPNSSAIIM